jgi:hypothetical protein
MEHTKAKIDSCLTGSVKSQMARNNLFLNYFMCWQSSVRPTAGTVQERKKNYYNFFLIFSGSAAQRGLWLSRS